MMSRPCPDPTGSESGASELPRYNAQAFETMVREHYGRLCAFAFRLLGSRDQAEDVVHEVLLRVWRDRDRFEFRDPLAYLYRAVRNQVISEHRKSGTRSRLLEERARTESVTPHLPDLAAVVEHDELAEAAARAVASLPERCRLVYTMRREQGLSYEEIALVLGVTIKTVENQMNRAAKLLRARLASYLSLAVILTSTATNVLTRIAG